MNSAETNALEDELSRNELDARRLWFCVEYQAWPTVSLMDGDPTLYYEFMIWNDGAKRTFTSPDPLKCIDLARRSVGI